MEQTGMQTSQADKPRRERGSGRIWRMGRIWWIQFYVNGRQVRESSGSGTLEVAKRLLKRRLGEKEAGIIEPARAARVTYEQMRDALLADYATNQRKSLIRQGRLYGLVHLDAHFSGWRAPRITADEIRGYIQRRQQAGAANGTINRDLALLRRMFRLAVEDRKLRDVPHFPMLKEAQPRRGFLEHAEYQKLRQELPEHLRPVLAAGYYTGMRRGEILRLRWSNVDLSSAEIRLDSGTTKNDEPRTIPLAGELLEMLRIERERGAESEYVFTRASGKIGSFRKAWKSATNRAGLPGLLFHDLRRTGVRNLVRAGVPERVAMAISGHKTRAIFERYNIVSGRDLRDAAAKLETYLAGQKGASSGQILPAAPGEPSITQ
jgi:integrase